MRQFFQIHSSLDPKSELLRIAGGWMPFLLSKQHN